MDSTEDRPIRKIWSRSEKAMLLQILKTEGHQNLNRIAAAIPNKSLGAIKALLNKYSVQAKAFKSDSNDPLDFWLHSYFSPEDDNLVAKALLFIRLFEEHPTPQELNGVDINSIYEFLHRSTLGHSPGELPPEMWKVVDSEVSLISDNVSTPSEREVLTYLSTFSNRQKPHRDYSRKDRDKTC
ncbi:uncharacterized protein LOC117179481 [Belonocnema kinseyi]|uniref:uncharacterized protein LOC117179481 n=1 Tax=Belonocnema kinseyi TaxID=2817044 RepID=UPI00143D0CAF|nr:uncharacterized protein LOC117179481 [Belonocnema kinseyi]XP_033227228.1 uncharacterized protein LOC117179481 [Belonocnema kinseyi]